MPAYVALLRAINVGGTGKLAMSDLKALCEEAGFTSVKTYIQSGNVVFASRLAEAKVKTALEKSLTAHMGKHHPAIVRNAAEMADVLKRNPFKKEAPNRVIVSFLEEKPPQGALDAMVAPGGERAHVSGREVFVFYGEGMAHSKLKLPILARGTGRNINTIAKLAEMAAEI